MSVSFFDLYSTLEWDKALEQFLSQSLDLETGALNIWNDVNKPKNLGHKDIGKTGINSSRGVIERWDGSTWIPIIGNIVTEKTIKTLVKQETDKIIKSKENKYINTIDDTTPVTSSNIPNKLLEIDEILVRRIVKEEINNSISDIIYIQLNNLVPRIVERYMFNNIYMNGSKVDDINNSPINNNSNNRTILNIEKEEVINNILIIDIKVSISEEDSEYGLGLYLTDNSLSWKGGENWLRLNSSNSSFDLGRFSKSSSAFLTEDIFFNNVRLPLDYDTILLVKNPLYVSRRPDKISSYILYTKRLNINKPLSININE